MTGASTAGSMIPSLLTHGTMYALHAGRVVCPDELYVSHGYNVVPLPKNSAATSCRIKSFLKQMPTHQRLHLLGNAWHLPVVSAWCLYVLSHCVWVNRNMTVQPERSLLRKGGSRLCELDWDQSPEKKRKETADDNQLSRPRRYHPIIPCYSDCRCWIDSFDLCPVWFGFSF